jgi:hypothetical protein
MDGHYWLANYLRSQAGVNLFMLEIIQCLILFNDFVKCRSGSSDAQFILTYYLLLCIFIIIVTPHSPLILPDFRDSCRYLNRLWIQHMLSHIDDDIYVHMIFLHNLGT